MPLFTMISLFLFNILPYFIIIFCSIKMVKYVNAHTEIDTTLKKMVKSLTKTLIILAIIPSINQAISLVMIFFSTINSDFINIIRLFIYSLYHFTPVLNPIVCILTNKPYRITIVNYF
ncbi:hypothetical protein Mgra_00005008 [Meloidogyne graminicola]|uniref:G-protein coupled receptors family 1 profile domain-containing protein n=1 Tax=Meloidogyne graminicola TaxID=189291 RepID=A0A8S9ZQD7_9BILA|nr:hypothetical protein Mgra_00005008 [Meloidogyne graminicola]